MAEGRPYRITTKEVIGKTVVAEDHVTSRLDVPPIVSREESADILRGDLRGRGFSDADGGHMVRERDGVRVEIDPEPGDGGGPEVKVSSRAEKDLPPPSNPSPCGCRAVRRMREEQSAHDDLQRQVTRRLEGVVGRLGCELEGVMNRVTKEALKRKAGRLGQIKQITEDPKSGSMTILVEV